jgi:hypothetical protein
VLSIGFLILADVSDCGFFSKNLEIFGWDCLDAAGGELALLLCDAVLEAMVV